MAAIALPPMNVSPDKPIQEPDNPEEVAHQRAKITDTINYKSSLSTDTEMAATGSEGAGPSRAPDSPITADETDMANDLGCVPLDGLITESMLNEEKELNRKSKEEEKRLQKESISAWQKEQEEHRYSRLQHLLEKSSIYSRFLLNKMEEQQKKEKLRQEKRAKKMKSKQEVEVKKEAESSSKNKEEEKENKKNKVAGRSPESGPTTRRSGRNKKQEAPSQEVPGVSDSQDQDTHLTTESQIYSDSDKETSSPFEGKSNQSQASLGGAGQNQKRQSQSYSSETRSSPNKSSSKAYKESRKVSFNKTSTVGKDQLCGRARKSSSLNPEIKHCSLEESVSDAGPSESKVKKGTRSNSVNTYRGAKTGNPRDSTCTKGTESSERTHVDMPEKGSPVKSPTKQGRGKTQITSSRVGKAKQPYVGTETQEVTGVETLAGFVSPKNGTGESREPSPEGKHRIDRKKKNDTACRSPGESKVNLPKKVESSPCRSSPKQDGALVSQDESSPQIGNRSTSNLSESNLIENTEEPPKSKGRKRRRDETYSIADYIDKSTLTSKKVKQGAEKTEKMKCKEECPSTMKEKNSQEITSDASQEALSSLSSDEGKPQEASTLPPAGKTEEEFVDTFSRTINGEKISDLQPDLFTGGRLRKYQLEGIEWLKVLYENGVNGILGDEMGLGKTVQCIGLFAHIIKMGVPGPFLVVAPLSTLSNWMSEFERFTPSIKVILYHGHPDEREKKRRQIRKQFGDFKTQPVVVTSYEIVMIDRKHLANHLWKYIIVDEGHRIKNLNCRLIRELKMYHSANRLLLTGTPLQNNLAELWSMLNFLLPEVFDDLKTFESWFDFSTLAKEGGDEAIVAKEREQHIVSMLHQILTPFLLRRLKSDVELNIPPKKEILVQAPLTAQQEELYKAIVDKTILGKMKEKHQQPEKVEEEEIGTSGRVKRKCRAEVDYALMGENESDGTEEDIEDWVEKLSNNAERCQKAAKKAPKEGPKDVVLNIKIKNIMSQLRKCCNHPYLLEYPLDPVTQEFRVDEEVVSSSGKFLVLDRLLPALKKRDHKVLLFSQMTSMLDILEDYCYLRKYSYCRLDGTMKYADRQDQINDFNKNQDLFLFLLSTRAGGLGINLTAADTVIIFDSDWNPQSDLQAQDRCHRIGQTKPVVIYRLVTSNTIDQKIVERAAAKRRLEKMVIHQGKFKGGKTNLAKDSKSIINPKELLELLRSCDHSGFVKNCNQKVISDQDLKLLLDRSDLLAKFQGKKVSTKKGAKDRKGAADSSVFTVLDDGIEDKELRIL